MDGDKLRIGVYDSGDIATRAPFDVRYQYMSSGAPKDNACYSSCEASNVCGGWWGCWQDPKMTPGQIVGSRINEAKQNAWSDSPHPQLYMFTYYGFLSTSGGVEGSAEVAAMNNVSVVKRHMDDYRLMLQKIGNERALVHIEPDLWGFVRSVNNDPRAIPAQVKSGNSTDCANHEDSAAGFARCMIDMVHKYAPNATVGLHASPWNHRRAGDAQEVSQYLLALGAERTNFIVTDPADRDAGYKEVVKGENWHWWTNADGDAFLDWSKQLSGFLGKPGVLWQIPLGNMSLDNTHQHYKDNKLDYFFANLDRVAASNVVGLMFGAGDGACTNPATDGGNLYRKTTANWQAGGTQLPK